MKQEMDSLRQKVEELQKQLAKATKCEAVNGTVGPAPLNKKVEELPQDHGESKRILDIIKKRDLENVKPPKNGKGATKKGKGAIPSLGRSSGSRAGKGYGYGYGYVSKESCPKKEGCQENCTEGKGDCHRGKGSG
jgi:hypothetical protein